MFKGDTMTSNLTITNGELIITCSNDLEKFCYKFIEYYNQHISKLKSRLAINRKINLLVVLTTDPKKVNFVYGKSDFAGFFTNEGAFAYINLNGKRDEEYMFNAIMHEIVHHIYKFYIYGKEKERITWVDEGIALFFSGQKKELENSELYNEFLKINLIKDATINLNELNHEDRSFNSNNGYNLSYIAIRYLYETKSFEQFIDIIKDFDNLKDIGTSILEEAYEFYITKKKTL